MPTFSIITPSLNQRPFLGQCLDSVRKAASTAGAGVEHIVIDGGSTDGSLEVLGAQSFARWISEPDRGQSDAINKGIRICSGDVVSYLCADDLLEPDALVQAGRAFAVDPAADVVYGDAFFLEEGWRRRKRAGPFSVTRLRRGNFLLQPAVFLKRGVFQKHGGFDPELSFCMDHEFWLRISGSTKWSYIPEPLACSRLHADAKTWSSLPAAWDEARRMQSRYGIRWRPLRDALWMRTLGCHYYRLKRLTFARIARSRTP